MGMDAALLDVFERGWRVVTMVAIPALAVPAVSFVFSLAQAFFGLRDEGVAYAVRVVTMIGVAFAVVPAAGQAVVDLMAWTLQ
jgi:type III secretory pathway component EscS